jgi:hypothetical protein
MKRQTASVLLCVALSLAVTVGGPARAADDPLAAKVSLTKPYPASFEGAETERIALQYAVIELAKQAGLGYDFKTSLANTDPTCKKWVTPQIQGLTLREALDKLEPSPKAFDFIMPTVRHPGSVAPAGGLGA